MTEKREDSAMNRCALKIRIEITCEYCGTTYKTTATTGQEQYGCCPDCGHRILENPPPKSPDSPHP